MSASDEQMIAQLTSRNVALHDALEDAWKMLRVIRDGGSIQAMEFHLRLAEIERALRSAS